LAADLHPRERLADRPAVALVGADELGVVEVAVVLAIGELRADRAAGAALLAGTAVGGDGARGDADVVAPLDRRRLLLAHARELLSGLIRDADRRRIRAALVAVARRVAGGDALAVDALLIFRARGSARSADLTRAVVTGRATRAGEVRDRRRE